MRDVSAQLKERFAREDLSICRCVTLTLVNGDVFYLTDLNRKIKVGQTEFLPNPAIDVAAIRTGQASASQSTEIKLLYTETGSLSERPVRFGSLNNATCEVFWVDYRRPDLGGVRVMSGKVASVETPRKGYCVLNIASAALSGSSILPGEVYSKRCRNVFGDKRCKVDVDALSVPFVVIQTFPDRASFAINGYADATPPVVEDPPEPPRENGELKQAAKGEFDFTVPNAQILRLRLASSGGGGATSGGPGIRINNRTTIAPGYPGNNAFPARLAKGDVTLFEISGGFGGKAWPGWDSKTSPLDFYLNSDVMKGASGALTVAAFTPDKFTPGGGARGGRNALYNNGQYQGGTALQHDLGLPGDGGDGSLIEHVFNLQDPACPIKAGDVLHFSQGSAGDSPDDGSAPDYFTDPVKFAADTSPGETGKQGFFELYWSSNVGEPIQEETFALGSVLWTKGDNKGQLISIAQNTVGLIVLANNPTQAIDIGDEGLIRPGCSNFADMCENRWNNLINMQAEPVTPQGVTSAPSPIADTQTDTTKPAPIVGGTDNFGFPSPSGA
jgi:hypothetical protein